MDGPSNGERGLARYASFLLRCAIDGRGCVRARLIEVGSGASHPLADLDRLPEMLRRLLDRERGAGGSEGPPGADLGDTDKDPANA